MLRVLIPSLPLYFVFGLLLVAGLLLRWERKRRQMKVPVSEKSLRPPGESLRLKIEELDEEITVAFSLAFGLAGLAGGIGEVFATMPFFWVPPWVMRCAAYLLVLPIPLYFTVRIYRLANARSDYRLGFKGERFVGDQLVDLVRDGCRIFHDVPGDGPWNIDHVVVGPTGVFVIETKTRRKERAPADKANFKVEYDGRTLRFPHTQDSYGLKQASDNARWLSQFLRSSAAESVFVTPILTLPGWWVESRVANPEVTVANPKNIPQLVRSSPGNRLDPAQIQRIVHQLDQRCRDVEF